MSIELGNPRARKTQQKRADGLKVQERKNWRDIREAGGATKFAKRALSSCAFTSCSRAQHITLETAANGAENHYHCPTINIDKLISLPEAQAEVPSGSVPVIDLVHLGKFKLLGKGKLDRPFIVKTRFVSKQAEQKIKEAGGVVKLVA